VDTRTYLHTYSVYVYTYNNNRQVCSIALRGKINAVFKILIHLRNIYRSPGASRSIVYIFNSYGVLCS